MQFISGMYDPFGASPLREVQNQKQPSPLPVPKKRRAGTQHLVHGNLHVVIIPQHRLGKENLKVNTIKNKTSRKMKAQKKNKGNC